MRQLASPLPHDPSEPTPIIYAVEESEFHPVCHRYQITFPLSPQGCNDPSGPATGGRESCRSTVIAFQQRLLKSGATTPGNTVQEVLAFVRQQLTASPQPGLPSVPQEALDYLLAAAHMLDVRDKRQQSQLTPRPRAAVHTVLGESPSSH